MTALPLVLFLLEVLCAVHAACPFGAVGSVHAWERIGAAIAHIARYFLKLPLLRYVDDYFGPERFACVTTFRVFSP